MSAVLQLFLYIYIGRTRGAMEAGEEGSALTPLVPRSTRSSRIPRENHAFSPQATD